MGYCCTNSSKKDEFLLTILVNKTDELKLINFNTLKEIIQSESIIKLNNDQIINSELTQSLRSIQIISDVYVIYPSARQMVFLKIKSNLKSIQIEIPLRSTYHMTINSIRDEYILLIATKENKSHIIVYDLEKEILYYLGTLTESRFNCYTIYNNIDGNVYICGGVKQNNDNSTSMEYFSFNEFEKKQTQYIIKDSDISISSHSNYIKTRVITFKDDFLLRKSNPLIIPSYVKNTFLICAGESMFGLTSTCTIIDFENEVVSLSGSRVPIECSFNSSNFAEYLGNYYSFISNQDHCVFCINTVENVFKIIKF